MLIQNLSRLQPLVLVIDDLHWVDPSTADLLTYLASRTTDLSLLIIGSYRPTEMALHNQQFNKTKLDLQSRGVCHDMPLKFLGRHDVSIYLNLSYPNNDFTDDFTEVIHRRTEGSPLFVVNLLNYLEEQHVITEVDGTWKVVASAPDLRRFVGCGTTTPWRRKRLPAWG